MELERMSKRQGGIWEGCRTSFVGISEGKPKRY